MYREAQEINIKILYIHRHMRNGLRTVHDHIGTGRMCRLSHFPDRLNRAEHIGHLGNAHRLYARMQSLLEVID